MSWARIEGPAHSFCLVAVFIAVALWETWKPLRELSSPAPRRWRNHGGMLLIAAIACTAALRFTPVALAAAVYDSRFGVLNKAWLPLPIRCALAIAIIDGIQYWIHWSFHHIPLLWRVHQVHHSDPDYDISTAARFHPLEVVFSQGLHLAAIAVLAPPPVAVFIALLLSETLNFSAHANASFPSGLDRALRLFFVTPGMHRVHHSLNIFEQQRNYGQTFAWWDRLFGTYKEKPAAEEEEFKTGLEGMDTSDVLGVVFMLREPFRKRRQEEPELARDPLA